MVSCERCWEQAQSAAAMRAVDAADEYRDLIRTNDCTTEQQAGREATLCPKCESRTVHQHARICIACGWEPARAASNAAAGGGK